MPRAENSIDPSRLLFSPLLHHREDNMRLIDDISVVVVVESNVSSRIMHI